MKNKIINLVIFIGCILSLLISLKLFWNMGIYVDEHNSTPSIVYGSNFWLYMNWLKIGVLLLVTILSGINLFYNKKK